MKLILGIAVFAMFCTTVGAQTRLTDGTYTVVKEVRSSKPTWTVIYSGHPASANDSGSPKLKYTLQFSEKCLFKSPKSDCDHPLTVGEIFGNHHFQPSGSLSGTMVSMDNDLGELTLIEFKGEGRSQDIFHFYKILRVETVSEPLVRAAAETKQSLPRDTSGAESQPSSQRATVRKDIPSIAKAANGAIVTIVMANGDKPIATGTGFLVNTSGVIVTNYHVIQEGNVAVVKLSDGTALPVDGVLAADKVRDLAVIKVHGKTFRTLALGNSDHVQVGEEVVAIGNPLGLELTVSNGILSGVRTVEKEGGNFLQITAPISHGSSGGPLFNMQGEVVGITSMYFAGGENLNFAIPVNDAKRLLLKRSARLQDLPNEVETVETPKETRNIPKPILIAEIPIPKETDAQERDARVRQISFTYCYLDPTSSVLLEANDTVVSCSSVNEKRETWKRDCKSEYPTSLCEVFLKTNRDIEGGVLTTNKDPETGVLSMRYVPSQGGPPSNTKIAASLPDVEHATAEQLWADSKYCYQNPTNYLQFADGKVISCLGVVDGIAAQVEKCQDIDKRAVDALEAKKCEGFLMSIKAFKAIAPNDEPVNSLPPNTKIAAISADGTGTQVQLWEDVTYCYKHPANSLKLSDGTVVGCSEINASIEKREKECKSKGPKDYPEHCKGLLKSLKELKAGRL